MSDKELADHLADGLDKNKTYPKDLRNNIPKSELENHPLRHGIIMQAHHLISGKGASNSGFKKDLIALNYEINAVNNLVFLPSTLKGACHLKVQVHRGDHTQVLPDGKTYHQYVQQLIAEIEKDINDCKSNEGKKSPIQDDMDKISQTLLDEIADFELPLSTIYENFEQDSSLDSLGCCNQTKIPAVKKALKHNPDTSGCSKGGNHLGESHAFSSSGKNSSIITYSNSSYTLRVGR